MKKAEYWKASHPAKKEVVKAKEKVYSELYVRLETKEGEQDLF